MVNDQFSIPESSPQDRVKAIMLKFLQRKRNIQPNTADGFVTGTSADSEGNSDGGGSGGATSSSSGQNN
jgi:hypothetical protein